jgi:hypothetical protein
MRKAFVIPRGLGLYPSIMPYTVSRGEEEAGYNTVDTLAVKNGCHLYNEESVRDISYNKNHYTFNGHYVRLLLQHKRRCSR